MQILKSQEWLAALTKVRAKNQLGYRAMYSSWVDGIVTEPALMILPIDDHIVHRGDGVFEALRILDGAFFDLEAHLQRLERSAQAIGLNYPWTRSEWVNICKATAVASGLKDALVRIYLSRGPGSFSPNPYESIGAQFYVVVCDFKPFPERGYTQGVKVMCSKIPVKESPFSQIKSCNYLHNVLMKKESVDAGKDFSIGITAEGFVAEGPTENLAIVTSDGSFVAPNFDYTLRGTTLLALVDLIQNKRIKPLNKVIFRDLKVAEIQSAQEVFMVGSTLEVLPVVEFAGAQISRGQPGAVAQELRAELQKMMRSDSVRRIVLD